MEATRAIGSKVLEVLELAVSDGSLNRQREEQPIDRHRPSSVAAYRQCQLLSI
jgi:hypothetical protein